MLVTNTYYTKETSTRYKSSTIEFTWDASLQNGFVTTKDTIYKVIFNKIYHTSLGILGNFNITNTSTNETIVFYSRVKF